MKFDDYSDVICWHHGLEQIYFERFGSYQGEWALLGKNKKTGSFYFFKDSYGSCSVCDNFVGSDMSSDDADEASAHDFAKDYMPFCEVPLETMRNLCANGTLLQVLPANVQIDEVENSDLASTLSLAAKIYEGWPITSQEILAAKNQEMRQKALKFYGQERFLKDTQARQIHEDRFGQLFEIGDIKIVQVKDPSTDRVYFLSVPQEMKTAKAAVASTFGLTEEQYNPIQET